MYLYNTYNKLLTCQKRGKNKMGLSDLPRNEGRRLSKETWKTGIQTGQSNSKTLMVFMGLCFGLWGRVPLRTTLIKLKGTVYGYNYVMIIYIYTYIGIISQLSTDWIKGKSWSEAVFLLPSICRFPAFVPSTSSPKLMMDLPTILLCLYPRVHECVYGSI